jgi:hypothetical protein
MRVRRHPCSLPGAVPASSLLRAGTAFQNRWYFQQAVLARNRPASAGGDAKTPAGRRDIHARIPDIAGCPKTGRQKYQFDLHTGSDDSLYS